jgi:hypothetical protein
LNFQTPDVVILSLRRACPELAKDLACGGYAPSSHSVRARSFRTEVPQDVAVIVEFSKLSHDRSDHLIMPH